MMIPWWTLVALTTVFFIREQYYCGKEKPNDYKQGYHDAVKDLVEVWNKNKPRAKDILTGICKFIKDNGWK